MGGLTGAVSNYTYQGVGGRGVAEVCIARAEWQRRCAEGHRCGNLGGFTAGKNDALLSLLSPIPHGRHTCHGRGEELAVREIRGYFEHAPANYSDWAAWDSREASIGCGDDLRAGLYFQKRFFCSAYLRGRNKDEGGYLES